MSVVRGRPPGSAGGMKGASSAHSEVIVDKYATKQFDIDDYRVVNRDAPALATGFLTHVLTEYTTAAEMPSPYSNDARFAMSHEMGLITESTAVAEMNRTVPMRRLESTPSGNIFQPPMTSRAQYYPIQYDMIMKSGANGRATQVDRVVTTVINAQKGAKP
jgi:hypothetical protein